jgi:hypothetical protein
MRKDDLIGRVLSFLFPKRKRSIKSGSCEPEASLDRFEMIILLLLNARRRRHMSKPLKTRRVEEWSRETPSTVHLLAKTIDHTL